MSKAIVKRSLEIFDDSAAESGSKRGRLQLQKKQKKSEANSSNFTKELSLEKAKSVQTIDQLRKKYSRQKDHTEDNLKKLLALSKNQVDKEKTTSIFKRGCRYREEPKIVESTEGTVFTEEDFAMFEREYLVD